MSNTDLSKSESKVVDELINNSAHPKIRGVHRAFSKEARSMLRDLYEQKQFLTVAETSIWLDLHPDTVYRFIKNGYIVAYRFGGPSSNWLVDVRKSKKSLHLS